MQELKSDQFSFTTAMGGVKKVSADGVVNGD